MENPQDKPTPFNLTVIFVKDSESTGYTAFFAQFPSIIAEGDNEEDATKNLFSLVKTVFLHEERKQIEETSKSSFVPEGSVTTKSFNMEFTH